MDSSLIENLIKQLNIKNPSRSCIIIAALVFVFWLAIVVFLPQSVESAATGIPVRPPIGKPGDKPPVIPTSTQETVTLSDGSVVYVQAGASYINLVRNNVVIYTRDIGAAMSVKLYNASVSSNSITVSYFYINEINGVNSSGSFTYSGIVLTIPASPIITPNITKMTNQNIVVQLNGVPSNYKTEYKIGEGGAWTRYGNPFLITANTTVFARTTDSSGNMSPVNALTVSNIDKAPPTAPTFSHIPADQLANSIRVTINYPTDAVLREYRLNESEWRVYQAPIDVNEYGQSIQARATDAAGNVSHIAETVMNFINRAPIAVKSLADFVLEMDEGSHRSELSEFFADPEQQKLQYSITNSNPVLLKHQLLNSSQGSTSMLNLQPQASGQTVIQITATDPLGKSLTQCFVVTILDTRYEQQWKQVVAAVTQAEGSQEQAHVNMAIVLINKLRTDDQSELLERIAAVQKKIDEKALYVNKLLEATQAVEKAESSALQAAIDAARASIGSLNESDKQLLLDRLNQIKVNDVQKPTRPVNLKAHRPTPSTIVLTWEASSDDVGVAGYDIFSTDQLVGSTDQLTFQITGLNSQQLYSFKVRAKDAAGNLSEFSNRVTNGFSKNLNYNYDAYGRLQKVENDGQVILQYEYDSNGNLIRIKK